MHSIITVSLLFVQFVNFTEIMSENAIPSENETTFAVAALLQIPDQYKTAIELGILGYDPYPCNTIICKYLVKT